MVPLVRSAALTALIVGASVAAAAQETAAIFQGEAAEQFLDKARMVEMRELGVGVTNPHRVTLELDGVKRDAVFKTIDISKPGATRMANGAMEVAFQDSWQTEIAAYVVDRIIGLGMVPATIERRIRGHAGSLQWWVESMMPEAERIKKDIRPPDTDAWNQVVYKMRLFDRLIYNVDRHLNNVLVTADFDLRLIDHSRAFRPFDELQNPDELRRFSRALLEGLTRLEFDDLKQRVGRYLTVGQIRTLLKRRDLILELAEKRVGEHGEDAVLYR